MTPRDELVALCRRIGSSGENARAMAELDAMTNEIAYLRREFVSAKAEVEALRRQVAELTALGVSLHKAEDRGWRNATSAIIALLKSRGPETEGWSDYLAQCIEQGAHEAKP